MQGAWRGTLYPTRLPTFHRIPATDEVATLVRWFWIPEWDIAPGRTSRQELLPFPACNLVVEPGSVELSGPSTGRSFRDLRGRGWAVGALLRPAAVPHLVSRPSRLRDESEEFDAPELHSAVLREMVGGGGVQRRSLAVSAYVAWIVANIPSATAEGVLANAMADLIDSDSSIVRVDDLAERLGVSVRTVQRLAERYFGLGPLALIRRRRLQEAAEVLRDDSGISVATVASELGYADHAHLSNEFRHVLGVTPTGYRWAAATDSR